MSHGIRPIVFEIIEDTDEEEETKRQLDEQIKTEKDAMFQDTVYRAQQEAEAQSQASGGFDHAEVDYGDDQDEDDDIPMEVEEADEEEEQQPEEATAEQEGLEQLRRKTWILLAKESTGRIGELRR